MELNNRISTAASLSRLAKSKNLQSSGQSLGMSNFGLSQPVGQDKLVSQQKNKNPSFTGLLPPGSKEWITNFVAKGAGNPTLAIWVGTLGALLISAPMPLMDKNAKKEDRIYSASWMAGMSLAGISTLSTIQGPAKKLANFVADKLTGYRPDKELLDALSTNNDEKRVLEALQEFPEILKKVIDEKDFDIKKYVSEMKGKGPLGKAASFFKDQQKIQRAQELFNDDLIGLVNQYKRGVVTKLDKATNFLNNTNITGAFLKSGHVLNSLVQGTSDSIETLVEKAPDVKKSKGFLGFFNPAKAVKAFFNEAKDDIVDNKADIARLFRGKSELVKHTLAHRGVGKIVEFATVMVGCMGATLLVSRYLGDVLNFASKKMTGKPFKEPEKTPEAQQQLEKKKRTDKFLIPAVATLVGGVLANLTILKASGDKTSIVKFVGNKLKDANVGKAAGDLLERLKITPALKSFVQKHENFLQNTAISKRWVEVNVGTDLVVRTMSNISSPYTAFRHAFENGLKLVSLGWTSKLLKRLEKPVAEHLFAGENAKDAAQVFVQQGVQTIGICSILMGFLNNAVSGKLMKYVGDKFGKKSDKPAEKVKQEPAKTTASTIQKPDVKKIQSERISKLFETSKLKQQKA